MNLAIKKQENVEASSDLQSLKDDLDRLWIRYLAAVDTYQASTTAISKHMADGFFALAQANRRSSSRQRYGQDFYDQRMKAHRLCKVSLDDNDCISIAIQDTAVQGLMDAEARLKSQDGTIQQPSPPATPEPEGAANEALDQKEKSAEDLPDDFCKQSPPAVNDPLRWYGVLTPKELHRTQSHFVTSVGDDLSSLANSATHLRGLEVDIGRLRKSIKKAEKALV